jgi:hypothetical protein
MRLTADQIHTVLRTVAEHAGAAAATDQFDSRLDDQARGGDLDLLVEAETPMPLVARARLQRDCCYPVGRGAVFKSLSLPS